MKRLILSAFLFFTIHLSLFCQGYIITTVTDLIVAHQYSQAHAFLDSILKKEENNIVAMMMKGNVLLNYSLDTTKPMQFITEEDESIFTFSVTEKPKLLSRTAVSQIEKYWKKCLQMDSSRVDILKGLCSVYAMALMRDSLESRILHLIKTEPDDGEQAYRIAEYARKFKERNRFDDAMKLYRFIAKQYPDLAGIRCDIASEYFYKGHINDALAWLDSCFNFKTVDETSFLNGAFIYSELGYFNDAQNVLNAYSRIYERKMDQFYYGLRLFADSPDKCFEVLKNFIDVVDSSSYFTEVSVAKKIVAFKDSFTVENCKMLLDDSEIPDHYKVLIYARGVKQFQQNCEIFVKYGLYEAGIKNYSAANQFLEEGEDCELKMSFKEYWKLAYAYSLYKSQEIEKTVIFFSQLIESDNGHFRQAATYFLAHIMIQKKEIEKAMIYKQSLMLSSHTSKYLNLIWTIKTQ